MNLHEDSLVPKEWKKIARKDWERIERQLDAGDAEAGNNFQAGKEMLQKFQISLRKNATFFRQAKKC